MNIEIIMETPQWLAINKPGALLVERSMHGFNSVEEEVERYLKKNSPRAPFVGIVHRLDRAATGVLLLAKKKQALKLLNEQFREHTVKKRYWALVENAPARETSVLKAWLYKDQLQKKAFVYDHEKPGALACSLEYKTIDRIGQLTWLEIDLHTGKFHQIRAQLAAIGCPIAGDAKYGATTDFAPESIALHARSLQFSDPLSHQKIIVEAKTPPEWNV